MPMSRVIKFRAWSDEDKKMRKYRIKYRIKSNIRCFEYDVIYQVQCKFKYIPFWVKVTNKFRTLEQAKLYIKLIKEEV